MSSTSKPPPDEPAPTFFLDRCLGNTIIATALRAAGHRVEVHSDHFPQTQTEPETTDEEWLRQIGSRGWIILSKDRNMTMNQIEIVALLESGTASFILQGKRLTGESMATSIIHAMPQIQKILRKFSKPFVATISDKGTVKVAYTQSDLIKEVE